MNDCEYIRFVEGIPGKKTKRWHVENKRHASVFGVIVWTAGWRQYTFCPMNDAIFSTGCLRDIARFCEVQTQAHRAAISAAKGIPGFTKSAQSA